MIKQCSGLLARALLVIGLLIVSVDVVKADGLKDTFEKMVQEHVLTEEQTVYLLKESTVESIVAHLKGVRSSNPTVDINTYIRAILSFYKQYPHSNRAPHLLLIDFQEHWRLRAQISNAEVLVSNQQQALQAWQAGQFQNSYIIHQLQSQLHNSQQQLNDLRYQLDQLQQKLEEQSKEREEKYKAGKINAIKRDKEIKWLKTDNEGKSDELERLKKLVSRREYENERLKQEALESGSQATERERELEDTIARLEQENQGLRQRAPASATSVTAEVCSASSGLAGCEQPCSPDNSHCLQIKSDKREEGKKETRPKNHRKTVGSKKNGTNDNNGSRKHLPQKQSAKTPQSQASDVPKLEIVQETTVAMASGQQNFGQFINRMMTFSSGHMAKILVSAGSVALALFVIKSSGGSGSGSKPFREVAEKNIPSSSPRMRGATAVVDSHFRGNDGGTGMLLSDTSVKAPNKAEIKQQTEHPCYSLPDYGLIELCLQQPPDKQTLMFLVWDLRHDLLMSRYTLYRKQKNDDILTVFPVSSVASGSVGDNFYLLPERYIAFADLSWPEQFEFLELLMNTSGCLETSLSEQLKKISLFGAYCGSLPAGTQLKCFSNVERQILKNNYESLNVFPLPENALNTKAPRFFGKAALMVSWPVAISSGVFSLANAPLTLMVLVRDHNSLELLYMKERPASDNTIQVSINVLEDGEFIQSTLTMVDDKPFWQHGLSVLKIFAGMKTQHMTTLNDAKLFYNESRSMLHLIVTRDGELIPPAWPFINGLIAENNRLLLSLSGRPPHQRQQTIKQLNNWKESCHSSDNCPVSIGMSYYDGEPVTTEQKRHRLNHLSQDTALWHASGLKVAQLKRVKKPLVKQWLWLLAHTIDAVYPEHQSQHRIAEIADLARVFCGISSGAGSQELAVACFQQLLERERIQADWKKTGAVSDFLAGFSSTKADNKPETVLVALRARLGQFRVTEPRFLPSLSYQGQRQLITKEGRTASRVLNLPPDHYQIYWLQKNLTFKLFYLDLDGSKKLFDLMSGTWILRSSQPDANSKYYFIEPENPYISTPYPAFPHSREHYSRESGSFTATQFTQAIKSSPCADSGQRGINDQLCKYLVDYTQLGLLEDLKMIASKVPPSEFKVPILFASHSTLRSASTDKRVVYRHDTTFECSDRTNIQKSKKPYHLLFGNYSYFKYLGEELAYVLVGYYDQIKEAGVPASVRWKVLYQMISNCLSYCEYERKECGRYILSNLQSANEDIWQALGKRVGVSDEIAQYSYPKNGSKKTTLAKLTKVLVFDRHLKAVRQMTLPVMKINGKEGFFPAYFNDPDSLWIHDVVLMDLKPDTEYRVELFSPVPSQWVPQESLTFTTVAEETTHVLKLSVDKLYRVSTKNEEVSYIFFPVQKIKESNELTDRYSVWRKVPEMPKLSWEQPVRIKKGGYGF
ncbi:hypothetical protein [Endozoicomonas euniceicola]|uniref:Uncharacterized protein n=1 Tax=Endozoicomonas euniceicola TaxID=1234143 RepID=A0ABY6GR94_9GAMM|nr:hypothetical protein [Endozoicomonas euniceicola]UYM15276.1 hypothetical protein NX720_20835 [Endozoicomonas euniceicola]